MSSIAINRRVPTRRSWTASSEVLVRAFFQAAETSFQDRLKESKSSSEFVMAARHHIKDINKIVTSAQRLIGERDENVAGDFWIGAASGIGRQNTDGNNALRYRQIGSAALCFCSGFKRACRLHIPG